MRALVDAGALAKAMLDVEKGTGRKSHLPILRNVLLEARPGWLRLTATNLTDPPVVREIPARGAIAGATTVPAKLLRDLARELRKMAGSDPILLEHVPYGEPKTTTIGRAANTYRPITREVPSTALLVMSRPFGFMAHLVATDAAEFPALAVELVERDRVAA
jgi:hypothetical protein